MMSEYDPEWSTIVDDFPITSIVVPVLFPGVTYSFRVRVESNTSAVSVSPWSPAYSYIAVEPPGAPGAPIVVDVDITTAALTLSWEAPDYDGFSSNIKYGIEYSKNDADWFFVTDYAIPANNFTINATVMQLAFGTNYYFRVYARNEVSIIISSFNNIVTTCSHTIIILSPIIIWYNNIRVL